MIGAAFLERRSALAFIGAAAFALALVLGIWLRFDNLGGKAFYEDEAYTALRASGHQDHRDLRTLFDGSIRPIGDVRALQTVTARPGASDTVASLAAEEPQHPPFFYLIDRWIAGLFGSTVAGYRIAAALFGVLAIFAAWLLGAELFDARTGAILAVLFALSPFEVLYSHEAREYSLTALMTLLCSYLLLRSLRTQSVGGWIGYAGALVVGVYSDPLIGLVIVSHAAYLAFGVRAPLRAKLPFAYAAAGALIAYVPWILVMLRARGITSAEVDWGATAYPMRQFLEKWAFNTGAQFFDLAWLNVRYAVVAAAILLFAAYAFFVLVRKSERSQWAFVLLLGGVTAAVFLGRDALQHSHWSTIARYLIPSWIAIQLAVAYALAQIRGFAGAAAICALAVLEGWSAIAGTRADSWYDNELSAPTPHIAAAINSAPMPALVVGEKSWGFFLDASNYLDPAVRVELFKDARGARIRTDGFASVFVTTPSPSLRESLRRQGFALIPVYRYTSASAAYRQFHRTVSKRNSVEADTSTTGFPATLYRVVRGRNPQGI